MSGSIVGAPLLVPLCSVCTPWLMLVDGDSRSREFQDVTYVNELITKRGQKRDVSIMGMWEEGRGYVISLCNMTRRLLIIST